MNKKTLLKLLMSLILVLTSLSCSKKSETVESLKVKKPEISPIETDSFFNFLPSSTLGFYIADFSSKNFKKLISSSKLNKNQKISDWIMNKVGDSEMSAIIKELISLYKDEDGYSIEKQMIFLTKGTEITPNFGAIQTLKEGKSEAIKAQVSEIFKKKEFVVTSEKLAEKDVNKYTDKTGKVSLYLYNTKDEIGFATDSKLIETIAKKEPTETLKKFISQGKENGFMKKIYGRSNEYGFGALDLTHLTNLIKEKSSGKLNEIPITFAFFSNQMGLKNSGQKDYVAFKMTDKFDFSIPTKGAVNSISKFNKDSVGALTIDNSVLQIAKKNMLENLPASQTPEIKSKLDILNSLNTIGISVNKSAGGTIFPELSTFVKVKNSIDNVKSSFFDAFKTLISQSPLPLSEWQEKEVNGLKTNYLLSPLGIGLFVANTENTLYLSTTENGLTNSLSEENKETLLDTLPKDSIDEIKTKNPAIFLYVDYSKVADMIKDASSSMSMFTGGQSNFDEEQYNSLKGMGKFSAALNIEGKSLVAEMGYF